MPDDTNEKYSTEVLHPAVVACIKLHIADIRKSMEQPGYKEYDPKFPEHIKILTKIGWIPKELGEWFLEHEAPLYDEAYKRMKKRGGKMMIINEIYTGDNAEEDIKKDIQQSKQFDKCFSENACMEIIESEALDTNKLFNKIDNNKDFGITKVLTDRCFYLPELMEKLELVHLGKGGYILNAQLAGDGKGVGDIGLEYDFTASSLEEAEKIKDIYKKEMLGGAIKTFTACWAKANEVGSFFYHCRLNDVIEQTYDPGRISRPDQEERSSTWRHLKMLEHTKLTMVIPVRINNKRRIERVNVGHRMVDLMGKSVEKDIGTPPETIYIKVLDAKEFYNTARKATPIAKTTLRQRPEKVLLFLSVQARQAQFEGKVFNIPEEALIKRAGLQKTFDSQPRLARKRLRDILDTFVKENNYHKFTLKNGLVIFFPCQRNEKDA